MLLLFSFALTCSLALGLLISLEEINPFHAKPLPMLDQIEPYLAQSTDDNDGETIDNIPLAA